MQTNSDLKTKTNHKNKNRDSKANKRVNQHKGSKASLSVRPTKHLCAERLACKGAKPEAHYICRECHTYQCRLCEELLHENPEFESHERQPLVVSADQIVCQNGCQTKNLADIHCVDCQSDLCWDCDQSVHSSPPKRKHQKKPIEQKQDKEEDNEEFYSCPYVSTTSGQTLQSVATDPLETIDLDSSGEDNDSLERVDKNETNCKNEVNDKQAINCHNQSSSADIAQLAINCSVNVASVSPMTGTGVVKMHSNAIDTEQCKSFLLIDEFESMKVESSADFAAKIGCSSTALIKVVSIFGNTGEGKSHTLNYTFFGGKEMFKTSATQNSCTIGIWCAYDKDCKVITIDTEGLLGISENNNRRTRLLLKVLAISDVIIYRTRAERLHEDLFTFLGDASRVYIQHFSKELKAATQKFKLSCPLSDLGPIVIVFHETLHTSVLSSDNDLTPEDYIRKRFQQSDQSIEAFSAVEYVGTQTITPPTDFNSLQETVKKHLNNSTVRSSRTSDAVFTALKLLNEKFSGDINELVPKTFFDAYFKCSVHCLSCNTQCGYSMNHWRDGLMHFANSKCKYQHQFNNQIYICRECNDKRAVINTVMPKTTASDESSWIGIAKYAVSGYVLECKTCGVIYRSRQYWYGNKEPTEENVVRTEIQHVWPDELIQSQGPQNVGQRAIDTLSYMTNNVSQMTARPSRVLADWMADQIAPSYWVSNNNIKHCKECSKEFGPLDQKHHCRSCGDGFCEGCSMQSRPVPERGWGDQPVRVCDKCFAKGDKSMETANAEVMPRLVGEMVHSTIGNLVSATVVYPREWIKESARPEYWVPDKDIEDCIVCKIKFSDKLAIHHCRACGQGVCDGCSETRRSIPERGWDQPVRTCDDCQKKLSVVQGGGQG